MARYVVMQKGNDAAGAEFIRDGFSVPALIVPYLWLLFYRQWLAASAVIGAMILGTLAAWHFKAPLLALAVDLPLAFYIALEGASLRMSNLEHDGWRESAVVEADTAEEAEIRFFGALPDQPIAQAPVLSSAFGRSSHNAFAFPARG